MTVDEITSALERQGGEEITVIKLDRPIDSISHFIIASGRSVRHLRKMSSSLVSAVFGVEILFDVIYS